MKKVVCFLAALSILLSGFALPAYAKNNTVLNVSEKNISHDVSQDLYGIFIEDISYGCDGGLVSNLVNNNSFEYEPKPEAAWQFDKLKTVLSSSDPMNENNPSYETLTVDGKGTVKNLGFTEIYEYKTYDYDDEKASKSDMGFEEGVSYDFSCYVRNIDYNGTISVYLDSKNNSSNIFQLNTSALSNNGWTKLSAVLKSTATEDGGLAITFEGTGSIDLDFVSLIPQNSYGYANDKWKYVTLREDLFDALKNLNPSFIRFPGGCLCEGDNLDHLYSWKDTIGELESRPQTSNIWANNDNGNYYNNTNSMGYHEYFQLCEELGSKAVPVLNVGLTCQGRNGYDDHITALNKVSMNDEQWKSYLINEKGYSENDEEGINEYTSYINSLKINSQDDFDKWLDSVAYKPGTAQFNNYVQDVLDLIEYANGDAKTTYWGALRAANGHEEPFNLEYIGLGNENWGDVYFRNFDEIYNIVKEKYPDITIISSSGAWLEGEEFDNAWKTINKKYRNTIVDEHYYTGDNYLFSHNDRYDSYDRDGAGVFVGEYAAKSAGFGTMITKNNIWSAVEEAGFMTGFERNSDIVKMTSYAPTIAKVNANSWDINMIWFDSQDIVLTPNYYVQMLFSNNTGNKYVDAKIESESNTDDIYQSVTVDESKQVIYVKLVNSGTKRDITVNIDGFEDIKYVSNQNISHTYKSASNEIGKNRVVPVDTQIESSENSFDVTLEQNSVNVVRIAYGENEGTSLYILPDNIDYKTKSYMPSSAKIIIACVVLSVAAGTVIGYLFYVKIISKRKKK